VENQDLFFSGKQVFGTQNPNRWHAATRYGLLIVIVWRRLVLTLH